MALLGGPWGNDQQDRFNSSQGENVNTLELNKWARLSAAFAVVLGVAWLLLDSIPNTLGVLNGVKADLLWPALALAVATVALVVRAVTQEKEKT